MEERTCEICKSKFSRYASYFKIRAGRFCSKKCELIMRSEEWKTEKNPIYSYDNSGENNPMYGKRPVNFKPEGSSRKDGYIRIAVGRKERKLLHRVIMEKYLGRELRRNEVVHHIDGDNTNNDITNLKVMSQSEHIALHRADLNAGKGITH